MLLQTMAANLALYSLRRFVRLQNLVIACAALAFILFPFLLALLIGFDTGLFFYVLAFLPIGFLAFPNNIFRAATTLAINIAFLVAMHVLALKWKPHYPAPDYIKIELNAIVIVLSILLFGIQILYLGFLTQVFQRIREVWMQYAQLGAEKYTDKNRKRNHIISNQIIMVFTIILVVMAVAQAVLSIILLVRQFETYIYYSLYYLVPTLLCIFLFLQIFHLKVKSNTNTRFEAIIFTTGNLYTLYLAYIQGREIGLHYVFLPLILVPTFFSIASARFKYAMTILPITFLDSVFSRCKTAGIPYPTTLLNLSVKYSRLVISLFFSLLSFIFGLNRDLKSDFSLFGASGVCAVCISLIRKLIENTALCKTNYYWCLSSSRHS
ncbi:MAG TPA: hypothetical protein PLY93_00455 [Turneriella sp.]|nr:hypothetical protein [Turneriella sp.]